MRRHSIIRPEQLAAEKLSSKMDPVELKRVWLGQLERVEQDVAGFPVKDLGCLFLDASGVLLRDTAPTRLAKATKHFVSVGGSWPEVVRSSNV